MSWLARSRRSFALVRALDGARRCVASSPRRLILTSPYPDVEIPSRSLNDHILVNVDVYKDKVALVDGVTGDWYKYSDVKDIVHRVASALTRRGFRKGDVLTLFADNNLEAVLVYHGVLAVGGAVNLVSSAAPEAEVARQMANCGSRLLLVTSPQAETAAKAAARVSSVKDIYVIGEPHDGCRRVRELIEDNGGASPWGQVEVGGNDLAILPHSSGTGGLPKTVMLTNRSLVANIAQTEGIYDLKPGEETLLGLLPFTHIYGTTVIFAHGMNRGAKIVSLPRFDPKVMLETVEKHRITLLNAVPPIILFLLQSPLVDQFDLSCVARCSSAAAPLLSETHQAFMEKFRAKRPDFELFQGYGLTEASPGVTLCPRQKHMPGLKYGNVGLLVSNTECRILKVGTEEEVGVGEEGEIVVRGPQIMKGYLNAPEETAACIRDGWYHTGDIGLVDEDGFFFVTDRVKELIKYKGHQVAPAELEALLLTHPSVLDCAVIGKKDERAGELPMAFVVKNGDVEAHDLQDFIASLVSEKSQLRGGVEFVQTIPKNPSGKILRRVLRQQVNA